MDERRTPAPIHRYRNQLRWSDMDSQSHINNVAYIYYLQEGLQAFLQAAGRSEVMSERHILSRDITFLAPLTFRQEPVVVETWTAALSGRTWQVAQVLCNDNRSTVFVEAETAIALDDSALLDRPTPDWRSPAIEQTLVTQNDFAHYRCSVRRADLAPSGYVNDATLFEYFQEARIRFMWNVNDMSGSDGFVVARVKVDHLAPLVYRSEPYLIETRLDSRSRSSFVLFSVLKAENQVSASAESIVVAFDAKRQQPRKLSDAEIMFLDLQPRSAERTR